MDTAFSALNLTCHARKSCAPCDCSDAEIAVRYFANPHHALGAMNAAQRSWCTQEIIRFMPEEDGAQLSQLSDDALARYVLKSWRYSVRF